MKKYLMNTPTLTLPPQGGGDNWKSCSKTGGNYQIRGIPVSPGTNPRRKNPEKVIHGRHMYLSSFHLNAFFGLIAVYLRSNSAIIGVWSEGL